MARGLPSEVPVLTHDALYKASDYAAFNTGAAVGVLRIVPKGVPLERLTFERDQIVILRDVLPDITPVAGIVSEKFSTPLAHVNLRARAWGIPNVGLKGAAKKYRALNGKTVRFEATSAGAEVRLATADEVTDFEKAREAARTVVIPPAELAVKDLRPLAGIRTSEASAFGAKTANLGHIAGAKLDGFTVPDGFGVPIHYYDGHMKRHGLDKEVERLLADKKFRRNAAYRKRALEALREKIRTAPLEPAFVKVLHAAVVKLVGSEKRGVFVRSSTNAEDLPGFNGAGLYDTVPNVVGEKAIHDAVRTVWASVWNLRAYEEREHFGIDHRRVYGGVLIQVGVDATAAGVLVTAHPANPASKVAFTINAKSGLGLRVVEGKKVPEAVHLQRQEQGHHRPVPVRREDHVGVRQEGWGEGGAQPSQRQGHPDQGPLPQARRRRRRPAGSVGRGPAAGHRVALRRRRAVHRPGPPLHLLRHFRAPGFR